MTEDPLCIIRYLKNTIKPITSDHVTLSGFLQPKYACPLHYFVAYFFVIFYFFLLLRMFIVCIGRCRNSIPKTKTAVVQGQVLAQASHSVILNTVPGAQHSNLYRTITTFAKELQST